jgi:nucleoside-diphosphate kinase
MDMLGFGLGPWVASGPVISKTGAGRKGWLRQNTSLRGNEPHRYKALGFHRELVMAVERTLSIIKPDATRRNLTGEIVSRFEKAGLRVVAQRRIRLSRAQAESFYSVHRERPFFSGLVDFMISGPVVVQVLEGEGAVAKNREVMGATDPKKAAPGTIRKDLAENIEANSVHGSDAPETAAEEIRFFFSGLDIVG